MKQPDPKEVTKAFAELHKQIKQMTTDEFIEFLGECMNSDYDQAVVDYKNYKGKLT